MRNILLLVIITIGTCLYSCIPINLSFNKSDNKIDYRNSYLNNLEFVKFEQNADTLQCFFIQPRYEFLDPVGAKQNTFYLLHDKTHAFNLKKPFEYIQVYVSVPLAKQKDPFLLLSASHDEYMELSSMYHSPKYSNLMHDLFVLNHEYKPRELMSDLNVRFGDYYREFHDGAAGMDYYDVTRFIEHQINNCQTIDHIDTLISHVVSEMIAEYDFYPVVYSDVKSYFDDICTGIEIQ